MRVPPGWRSTGGSAGSRRTCPSVRLRRPTPLAGDDLTPYVDWSFYGLRKAWNVAKDTVAPWWGENSKEAYATGLERLARALKNWSASRRGKRKGSNVGFGRFRSKHKPCPRSGSPPARSGRPATQRPCRYWAESRCTRTSPTAWLAPASWPPPWGFERGRWFVSFTVEQDVQRPRATKPDDVIGVDLGIKTLAAGSDGTEIPNPRHLSKALRKVRRAARRIAPAGTGPAHRAATLEPVAARQRPPQRGAPPGRGRPLGRYPQDDHQRCPHVRHGGDRGPVRCRDGQEPAPGPARRGRVVCRDPSPARLQDRVARRDPDRGRSVVPVK